VTNQKGQHEAFISAWLDQVCRDGALPGNAFRVAYAIAQHLNGVTRIAWPSQATVMAKTALSESTVKAMIVSLRARGHLDVASGAGRGHSSRYRLIVVETGLEPDPINQQTGLEPDPFTNPEKGRVQEIKGSSSGDKRVEFEEEKGRVLNPDLLNIPCELPSERQTLPTNGFEDEFEQWWIQYPRRVAKAHARRAYEAVRRKGKATAEELLSGAMRYAAEKAREDPKFTKHPATWLNGQCWLDESAPPPRPNGGLQSAMEGLSRYLRQDDDR
jgi:helix-turn-helix protein